jgi:CBS domain-containing protein
MSTSSAWKVCVASSSVDSRTDIGLGRNSLPALDPRLAFHRLVSDDENICRSRRLILGSSSAEPMSSSRSRRIDRRITRWAAAARAKVDPDQRSAIYSRYDPPSGRPHTKPATLNGRPISSLTRPSVQSAHQRRDGAKEASHSFSADHLQQSRQTNGQEKCRRIMVVDDRRLVGIFTERDAVFRVIARDLDCQTTRLVEVMTKAPITAAPDNSFGYALLLMHENGFRHVPVIDNGKLIGVVSARNALDPDMEEFVSEAQRRRHILRERT